MLKRIISSAAVVVISVMGASSPVMAQSSFGSSASPIVENDYNNPVVDKDQDNNNNGNYSVIVNQGDYIQTRAVACTLAYIGDDFAITAAHCGSQGDKVYSSDPTGRKLIGHFDLVDYEKNQDVAIIKLASNVGGKNIYSGDNITSMGEMSRSDEFCQFGTTTHEVLCGPQTGLPRYGYMWSTQKANHGDSGGPVWIPGKGLIGVISSKLDIGTGLSEAWITANKYGITENMAPGTSDWVNN